MMDEKRAIVSDTQPYVHFSVDSAWSRIFFGYREKCTQAKSVQLSRKKFTRRYEMPEKRCFARLPARPGTNFAKKFTRAIKSLRER